MSMNIFQVAKRNVNRNLRRSILSGVAIMVSSMSILLLFAFLGGMTADMEKNLTTYYTGDVRVRNASFGEFERYNPIHLTVNEKEIASVLSEVEEVETYVPRITIPSSFYINGGMQPSVGIGADFEKEANFQDLEAILKQGKLPSKGAREMLLGAVLAKDLGVTIGDSITVMSTTAARGTNAITLEVVGLAAFPVASLNTQFYWVDIDTARYFLKMNENEAHEILIRAEGNLKQLAATIGEKVEQRGNTIVDSAAFNEISDLFSLIKIAEIAYYFIGAIFLFLGSTVIINTTMMVIYERMREIGTLSALGMRGKGLIKLFFTEGLIISTIASFLGVLLGSIIVLYLSKVGLNFEDVLSGVDMEVSSMLYPTFNILVAIVVFLYSLAITAIATFIPSRKASRIEVVEALRYV
ncbi:MAG: ABC transporter permease [Spirochaetia bacterium]|nr:ABC transporter permease [Spirochaetia bacterium]